ncbi:MAG: hypothetical protein ACK4E3_07970 [Brevundimonas sp.]|uniref:hypothetical protein n=1 Tax=Brevundimonas sp. TaxID=1871086 RepID=UPI003919234D
MALLAPALILAGLVSGALAVLSGQDAARGGDAPAADAMMADVMMIDGQCLTMRVQGDDLTATCRPVMDITTHADGTTEVGFEAQGVRMVFIGGGRTANLDAVSYLVIDSLRIEREGSEVQVVAQDGHCARAPNGGGRAGLHVRCTAAQGAVAEFSTQGTPVRRPAP